MGLPTEKSKRTLSLPNLHGPLQGGPLNPVKESTGVGTSGKDPLQVLPPCTQNPTHRSRSLGRTDTHPPTHPEYTPTWARKLLPDDLACTLSFNIKLWLQPTDSVWVREGVRTWVRDSAPRTTSDGEEVIASSPARRRKQICYLPWKNI